MDDRELERILRYLGEIAHEARRLADRMETLGEYIKLVERPYNPSSRDYARLYEEALERAKAGKL